MGALNIKRFLESEDTTFKFDCGMKEIVFFKVDTQIANLKYVYAHRLKNKAKFLNPSKIDDSMFIGVYDTKESFLYEYSEMLREPFCYDIEGLDTYKLSMLKALIEAKVQDKVITKIDLDESKLSLTKEEIEQMGEMVSKYQINKDLEECLILGETLDKSKYANYNIEDNWINIDDYMGYLIMGDKYIEHLATTHIEAYKYGICTNILQIKETIKAIEENKDNEEYIVKRNLNAILGNKDYKTLNIKYSDGNSELTFKINNPNEYKCTYDNLSIHEIKDTKSRTEFEIKFKGTEILPTNIQNITYSKDILYTK